jgi:hypothetical protein
MLTAVANATTDDDPAAIAAIHAWGAAFAAGLPEVVRLYEELLELNEDPALERGIELVIELNRIFVADLASNIEGVETLIEMDAVFADFAKATEAAVADPDDQRAIETLNDYSVETCGFPLRDQ